ncbi:MAG: hypothetical protein IKN14_02090 [Clostridiales bacterium]|nr:hypothetical protein [Clostridiales bacterium]
MKKNNPSKKVRTPDMEGTDLPVRQTVIPGAPAEEAEVPVQESALPVEPSETEAAPAPAEESPVTVTAEDAPQTAGDSIPAEPVSEGEAPVPSEVSVKHLRERTVLSDLTEIDPDLLSGDDLNTTVSSNSGKTSRRLKTSERKKNTRNEVEPVVMNLSSEESKEGLKEASSASTHKGVIFLIVACIAVLIAVGLTVFFGMGIKEKLQSPLKINDSYVDSAEFSFMYHYLLIDNGVDIFASDTPDMLAGPSEDPNFKTTRDYFLDLTAQEMQTMQILYDDATSKGYEIENSHFELAQTYIDWLATKAKELNVPLDTYIRGVFGSQVDEQCVLNTLAKKYFTEDYASGAKLVELQATKEQAEEAYTANRNAYDLVNYKILRITYEQREEAFINTANLHAAQIIDKMGHDPSKFESCAAEYFSGEAKNVLMTENSTLISNARYADFTHNDFRDWLFDTSRTPGDATVFADEDGFPIILCFVSRERQTVPLRDVRMVHIVLREGEEGPGLDVAAAQTLAQEIFDQISEEKDMQSIENLYNDYILDKSIEVIHSSDTYPGKYSGILDKRIFSEDIKPGDKLFLDTEDGYYIVYLVSVSENPEWYDRVNSFIRMNNYQAFLNEMRGEYEYSFIQSGVDKIQDVP